MRTLERAGLRRWRDLAERTPPQILECSGAGLILLTEIVACALELSATWFTDPQARQSTSVFGYSASTFGQQHVCGVAEASA